MNKVLQFVMRGHELMRHCEPPAFGVVINVATVPTTIIGSFVSWSIIAATSVIIS
jgi:hypothetical protein